MLVGVLLLLVKLWKGKVAIHFVEWRFCT